MKLRLQINQIDSSSSRFEHAGPVVRIGRNPEGEVSFPGESGQVSWDHARIELTSAGAYLSDLNSTNGTLVNERQVNGRVPLDVGDQIQLGHTGPVLRVTELSLPVDRAVSEGKAASPGGRKPIALVAVAGCLFALLVLGSALWFGSGGAPHNKPRETSSARAQADTSPERPPSHDTAVKRPAKSAPKPRPAPAADAPPAFARRMVGFVASEKSPPFVLLERQSDPYPWGPLRPGGPVYTASYLVSLPGYRSTLLLDSGVHLTLWGNLPDFSNTSPVLESTVMLQVPGTGLDADFTLDHGRVRVANRKPKGAATVRVRFFRETWDLTLADTDTEAVLDLWSFYPRDVPFRNDPGGKGPTTSLALYVKGRASLNAGGKEYALPDRSQLGWSNRAARPAAPEIMKELPAWWTNKIEAKAPAIVDAMLSLKDYAAVLQASEAVVDAVLTQIHESPDPTNRALGVLFLGALDAVAHLADCLADPQHPEVRGTAAFALRQWVARSGGQDQELYRILFKQKGYSREKAEIILRLLHPFSDADLQKPATYQTLIGYLDHENLPIRELALWHLALLMPEGTKIPYDPVAPADKRKAALAQWKRLIPPGTVPPRRTANGFGRAKYS